MDSKNIATIVMAVLLFLSILSYASIFITPKKGKEIPIYFRKPLTDEEINQITKEGKVLILYYWNYDCDKCYNYELNLRDLVETFNGSVVLDAMDTYNFPDIPYLDLPYIVVIGNGKKEYHELVNISEIKNDICNLSFEKPKNC